MNLSKSLINFAFAALALLVWTVSPASAANPSTGSGQGKPNILVIWGDDIGITNISAYTLLDWSGTGHPISTVLPKRV